MNRVLTLEEAIASDVFWYESIVHDPEYGRISCTVGNSVAISRIGSSGWAYEDDRYYGSSWRCWEHRPTLAERKSVQWEG